MPVESFEETYPRYPFAVLVEAAIAVARWLTRSRAERPLGSGPVTPQAAR